ncbi:MAG: GntR family transcriptional regulator, partial [Victivallaceae bacterium]
MSDVLKKDSVYNQLRQTIRSGKLKPDDKLPGELQLANDYNISRVTLRSALQKLEQEKLIVKVNGKGTFVSKNIFNGRFLAISPSVADVTEPMQYILPGIKNRLAEMNIKLEVCSKKFVRNINPNEAGALFKKHEVRGVFLLGGFYNGDEPELNMLKASGLPILLPHAARQDRSVLDFAMMISDDRLAFGDGIRQLASQGHKRIGTIFNTHLLKWKGECRGFTVSEFLEFLKVNRLAAFPDLIKDADSSMESIFNAVKELMFGPNSPTAIMCFSDFYAIYVYEALRRLKITTPEQVSVMGYCGYPGGQLMSPALSTVDLMYENIGQMAADLMLRAD